MWQTLLRIPHEISGLPIFGMGWALIGWAVLSIALLGWLVKSQGFSRDTQSYIPLLLIMGLAILFVAPWLEEKNPKTGEALGLAIRGYGVMMLLGVTSAVALAAQRARRMGIDPEIIFSLAFWMFLFGIAGARIYYVVQKSSQYEYDSLQETVLAVLKVTEGGLVVYGSAIGGFLAAVVFLYRRKLPMLAMGDIIAPSLALGVALGRLGCFLNGCCYGGACSYELLAVEFPQGTPPYVDQQRDGLFHGVKIKYDLDGGKALVKSVAPGSKAEASGLKAGEKIKSINGYPISEHQEYFNPFQNNLSVTLETVDGRLISWRVAAFPSRSLPLHPTQLYSAINGGLVCLFLWVYYPFRRRDGEIFALFFTFYPIARFLLEMIRNDEGGVLGTWLTSAQIISLAILVAVAFFWAYLFKQPPGSVLPLRPAEG